MLIFFSRKFKQEAIQLKDTFEIGLLDGSFNTVSEDTGTREVTVDDDDWTYEEPKTESSSYTTIFISLGVLMYAFIFYYMYY